MRVLGMKSGSALRPLRTRRTGALAIKVDITTAVFYQAGTSEAEQRIK